MATVRPFDFRKGTQNDARMRQEGRCACCGRVLKDQMEHAHHVVPNQCGNPSNPSHQWLREVENCVVLCDACHTRVHQDGRFAKGAVAPPAYFEHARKDPNAQRTWVADLEAGAAQIWMYVERQNKEDLATEAGR